MTFEESCYRPIQVVKEPVKDEMMLFADLINNARNTVKRQNDSSPTLMWDLAAKAKLKELSEAPEAEEKPEGKQPEPEKEPEVKKPTKAKKAPKKADDHFTEGFGSGFGFACMLVAFIVLVILYT